MEIDLLEFLKLFEIKKLDFEPASLKAAQNLAGNDALIGIYRDSAGHTKVYIVGVETDITTRRPLSSDPSLGIYSCSHELAIKLLELIQKS